MLPLILTLLACGPETPSEPEATVAAPEATTGTEVAKAEEAKPAGRIGGVPILPDPIILGGISVDALNGVMASKLETINDCFEAERMKAPDLSGKVLVKFSIREDGSVRNASTHSTSLRNETAEACMTKTVAAMTFPELENGGLAVVHYPFEFPRT
ncbi:MAG: AgmX/PglI C-terminal domain-containing protein [Proteobacteria bacterium]|nr:AgmX/PglI C-terminal domain-containing protein [Pseudomonadota bacterium]